MIIKLLICIAIASFGALIYKATKPEYVTAREFGRAMIYAGVFWGVWVLAISPLVKSG